MNAPANPYPETPGERDRWILARRGPRPARDVQRPQNAFLEPEPDGRGGQVTILTLLLTGRECPWRCLMCDLWQYTTDHDLPLGAVPAQIALGLQTAQAPDRVLDSTKPPRWIKLYNSGSFFDPRSVPPADHPEITRLVSPFDRVIVECHPALIGPPVAAFRALLAGSRRPQPDGPALEVAMGLETVHPRVLDRLNKRMTLEQFRRAADFLARAAIALRVFVLVKPPFLPESEALEWAQRSIDFAFDAGAAVVSLIPTRPGNGALDALAEQGEFSPPRFALLEAALDYGLRLQRGRVLADLWDTDRIAAGEPDLTARVARVHQMNLTQSVAAVRNAR